MSNASITRGPSGSAALLQTLAALPAERRRGELLAHGDVDMLLLALGDEAEKLVVVDVARANACASLVAALADQVGSAAARARARRALGQALAYAGRFADALSTCREAASIASEAGEFVQAARARLASIHALSELGRYNEALEAGESAHRMLTEAKEPALAARADLNLGVVRRKRDQPLEAVRHFNRAREVLRDEPGIMAQLESNLGEALLDLNDLAAAEEAFGSALAAFDLVGHRWGAAIVEGNLADLATRQGRFDRALYHFESARRRLEQDESPSHLARLLVEQAEAKAAIGMTMEAVGDYRDALRRLASHGQRADVGRASAGLARALLRLGRGEEAEGLLEEARTEFSALSQFTPCARIDLLRSESALSAGDPAAALGLAQSALARLGDRPIDRAMAQYHRARALLALGRTEDCDSALEDSIAVARSSGIAPLLADLLTVRADLCRVRGDVDAAVGDSREAVACLEQVRSALQADRFRAACLGDRLDVYCKLAAMLLETERAGCVAEAFRVVEQAKARSLMELVRGVIEPVNVGRADAAGDESGLAARLLAATRDLNNLFCRLDRESQSPRAAEWREGVRRLEAETVSLEDRLAAAESTARVDVSPSSVETIRKQLEDKEALLEFAVLEGNLHVFVLRADGPLRVVRLSPMSRIDDLARRVRFQIGRGLRPGALNAVRSSRLTLDARAAAAALYDAVLRPVEAWVADAGRLVIVPHGSLHSVPFAALWDGQRHLVEGFEIVTAPSASMFAHLRQRSVPSKEIRAVVIGVADERAPSIEREARLVASCFDNSTLVVGEEAVAVRAMDAVNGATCVHISSHGRFDSNSPLSSGVRLHDRWLTVRDLQRMNLRGALVTLSGCETGRSEVRPGEELLGMVRAVFAAGASSIALSLWIVDDASTLELMRSFYSHLVRCGGTGGAARAMREAQIAMLAANSHPSRWASFALEGLP